MLVSFSAVFAVAAAVTYVTTPLARRLAARAGAVDIPNDRKVHSDPTPRWGGLAMFVALLAGIGTAWSFTDLRDALRESSEVWAVLGAATVVLVVGAIDDVRDVKARTKLAGHLLAAGVLVLGGVQIFYMWLPGLGVVSLSADLSALLTVLWAIAVINSINLVDGLDGLATGVTTIAAVTFFVYGYRTDASVLSLLIMAIAAGAGVGFLRHNFQPAKIFMGDSGAYLLGLLLASATVSGISRTTEPQLVDVAGFFVPVLLPVIALAIPLADATFAVARRMRKGGAVFHPDKQHIHHWLLDMAGSHRSAVLIMYLWSSLLAAAVLVLALGPGWPWRIAAGGILSVLVGSVLTLPRMMRRGRRLSLVGGPASPDQASMG